MKTPLKILASLFLITLSACSSYQYSLGTYADDLYYNPKDKPTTVASSYSASLKPDNDTVSDNFTYSNDKSSTIDTRDFSKIQKEYEKSHNSTNNNIKLLNDSTININANTGYWANDFNGSQQDKDYAERIANMHGPLYGIPSWSPLYDDVMFNSGFDYNVYVNDDYAYVSPSWTSPYYNDWRYGFASSWGGYNGYYGFNRPWYNRGYFDYSYGYSPYRYAYSGWDYPGWGYGYGAYPYYRRHYPSYGWGYNSFTSRERAPRHSSTLNYGTRLNRARSNRNYSVYSTRSQNNRISPRRTRASYNSNRSPNITHSRKKYNPSYSRSIRSINSRSAYDSSPATRKIRSTRSTRTIPSRSYNTGSSRKARPATLRSTRSTTQYNSRSTYGNSGRSSYGRSERTTNTSSHSSRRSR